MISTVSYYIARVVSHIYREVVVGIELARMETTIVAPVGISVCGQPVDDHEDLTCDDEALFPWGGEDDEE